MNTRMQTLVKLSLQVILITGTSLLANAQKLKAVQEGSVWAPAGVKVDAKLGEWNDSFEAYNKTTLLSYTLSNDDKNLYLVVKSTDFTNNNKITGGGISLTINTADKKKEKDAFTLTFPVINRAAMRGQGGGAPGGGGRQRGGGAGPVVIDTAALVAQRKAALATVKELKVFGFKDIQDSIISIYNEYGIKVAADFDAKGSFVYELALPLKLMDLSTDNPKEFAYNIKVNGIQAPARNPNQPQGPQGGGFGGGGGGFGGGGGGRGGGGGGGGGAPRGGGGGGDRGGNDRGNIDMERMMSPTDFWGKYILAKKQ